MLKSMVFISLLLPIFFGFTQPEEAFVCTCATVTNLDKAGGSYNSVILDWDSVHGATKYRLWYVRQEDSYTSGDFFTTGVSFEFTALSNGHYTFYVAAVCGNEESGFIGIEDQIQN